jgi:hypothetical protein
MNILDVIIANGTRDELEDLLATIAGVLGRLDIDYDGYSAIEFKIAELKGENRALLDTITRLKNEAALMAHNIEVLRRIIDDERGVAAVLEADLQKLRTQLPPFEVDVEYVL